MICKKCRIPMNTGILQGTHVWYCNPVNGGCGRFENRNEAVLTDTPANTPGREQTGLKSRPGCIADPLEALLKAGSEGEEDFAERWNGAYPQFPFIRDYEFHGTRRWRIDFAWPDVKVAVEYEGGGAYGHGKKNRYDGDITKYNAMAYRGWRLLRVTKQMMDDSPYEFMDYVADCIRAVQHSQKEKEVSR